MFYCPECDYQSEGMGRCPQCNLPLVTGKDEEKTADPSESNFDDGEEVDENADLSLDDLDEEDDDDDDDEEEEM